MRSSRISAILQSLRELPDSVHVHGATGSARAQIAARAAAEVSLPTVVLCADDDTAAQFAEDLETLSQSVLGRRLEALHFPTWEQSAYSPIAPSIRTRLSRTAVLGAIHQAKEGQAVVLVTTLAAACQATLPKEVFERHLIRLKVEESVDSREALMGRLLEGGYLRVDPVEDPGTFAVRGDIVDIFPPGRERPVRLELFGDLIERIREFDPGTQRALEGSVPSLPIAPAREALINRDNVSRVRERLKSFADDAGVPRPVRDPILGSVHEANYPDHSDTWTPLTYENPSTLWDHLGDETLVIWNDELSCQQFWDDFLVTQTKLAAEAPGAGLLIPPPAELFRWNPALERRVRGSSKLFLDRIE
ncbi:MAG: hypothetical protein ACXVBW_15465, partial [Bdellovibrionota bacterium]